MRTREITLRRKDGSPGVFLDTSRAVWDAGGKIVRYQGTLVDVSERREMEKSACAGRKSSSAIFWKAFPT